MSPFQDRLTHDPVKTHWLPAVCSDETFLRVVLFTALVHQSVFCGRGRPPQYDVHLARVIVPFQNRLAGGAQHLAELTIATAFCLAMIEGTFLNQQRAFEVHSAGALHLVELYGGVHKLQPWLQNKVRKYGCHICSLLLDG